MRGYEMTGGAPPEEVRMELSLATRTVADHTVLEVGGEVDVYTAPRLRERLIELIDRGARDVVVDLGRVDFLDSTGLGVLVGALKRLRAVGGTFSLVCAREPLLKIFRITALDQVFPLHESVEAATRSNTSGARPGQPAEDSSQPRRPPQGNGGAGQGNIAGPAQ